MERIRIATWNVWWQFGPWEDRQPLIDAELERVQADVVCLQEAYEDAAGESQPARIVERLGLAEYRFVAGKEHKGVGFGNAILSRWPIERFEAHPLQVPDPRYGEHRTALLAQLATPVGPVVVCTAHLNYRWDQSHVRQSQVDGIFESIASFRPLHYPPILTGDLNADPLSDEIRTLTGRRSAPVEDLGFFDAWEVAGDGPGLTWDRSNPHTATYREPSRRIDYVLVGYPMGPRGQVLNAELIGTEPTGGLHPSDHFGLIADLTP